MQALIRLGAALLVILTITGCSLLSDITGQSAADSVVSDKLLVLLPPDQGPTVQMLKQTVTLTRHGHQVQFLTVSRFEAQQVKLLALLPSGQPLMELNYDGQTLTDRVYGELPMNGQDILAVVQFSLWSQQSLEQYYVPEQGWQLEISKQRRLLSQENKLWLKVEILPSGLIVDNYSQNYRVRIHTLEKMDL